MQWNVTKVQFETRRMFRISPLLAQEERSHLYSFQMMTLRLELFLYSLHARKTHEASICVDTLTHSQHLLWVSPSFGSPLFFNLVCGRIATCRTILMFVSTKSGVSHMSRPPRCKIPLRDPVTKEQFHCFSSLIQILGVDITRLP